MIILKHFHDDKYSVLFNTKNGLFIRKEDSSLGDIFWASHGPELIDVSITNYCERNCNFCYRSSSVDGNHMCLDDYVHILKEAKSLNVFQIALGGGNPNQHPLFIEILKNTFEYGIVPNYTTNGDGITKDIIEATKQYCGAVAISAYKPYANLELKIKAFVEAGVITNIHFLLNNNTIETALSWLKDPPYFLKGINAIIFLNYKNIGRNLYKNNLLKGNPLLKDFFRLATSTSFPFKIGFDSCSITGLARWGSFNENSVDFCDAGRFSLFISENLKVFPCSFMVGMDSMGISLKERSLEDIWKNDISFKNIRSSHQKLRDVCHTCTNRKICNNGCPVFEDINLCDI